MPQPTSATPLPTGAVPRVVVIGAGVAGLLVARDLARAGVPVTLVEASDRVGGQLAAVRIAGLDVDAAAESFATRGGVVETLAGEIGLGDDIVRPLASPAWLIGAGGRACPLPAASVLGIPADPRAADVVRAIGAPSAWRARWDAVLPLRDPASYRTIGDLVRRRMGAGVLRRLVAPVVRGVYSASPDALALEIASPGMRDALREAGSLSGAVAKLRATSPAGSQVAGVRGGVHRFADALADDARRAGATILLGTRAVRVDDEGVVLDSGERLDGRVVHAAADLVGPAERTRTITVAIAAVDAHGLDHAPRGTGALIEEGVPGIRARAFTHASAKWEWLANALPTGRHLVRLSYDEMPEDAEATVLADLRAITATRIDRLVDLDVRTWTRTLQAHPVAAGRDAVGEASSVTGLAGIVAAARVTAQKIMTDVSAAPAGGREGTP